MDMTIGEFEEVGEVIKSFTSDQATVVVGTVIDPEMSDELRVTIVVTGLNAVQGGDRFQAKTQANLAQAGRPSVMRRHVSSHNPQGPAVSHQAPASQSAYQTNHQPINHHAVPERVSAELGGVGSDYLDIPTFLRRQSD